MKLSIVIPVYNTKKEFLLECLSSVSLTPYEIIVIDDGSMEDYTDVLQNFKNVKYIKTENSGVSSARNVGLGVANGDYIFFLDSDDKVISNNLKEMLSNADDNDIVLSRNYIKNGNKVEQNKCSYETSFKIEDKNELISSLFLLNQKYSCVDTVWAKLYKRSFLKENNIEFNEKLTNGEDILFNYICYNRANNIYFYNDPTYIYRVHSSSVCQTYQSNMDDKFITFISELQLYIENNNINEPILKEHIFRVVCRLFRKFYSYCSTKDEFEQKIFKILNNDIFMENLSNVDIDKINNDQKVLLKSLNLKHVDGLYDISRNAKNLSLK